MKKAGLWLKFVVAFVAVQILAFAVIGYLGTTQIRRGIEAEKEKQGIIIVDLLTSTAMPAIFSNDFVALQNDIDSIFIPADNTEVVSVVIRNSEGRIIAERERGDASDSGAIYKIEKKIYYKGTDFGTIQVGLATSTISQNVSQILLFLAVPLVLTAIVAGISVLYLVFVLVTKPLDELVSATKGVAAGDFSRRIEFERDDELGELAVAFNTMTEYLETNETELKNRLSELATLYETGLSISGSLDTERILRTILDNMAVTLPIRSGTVFVRDRITREFKPEATFGPPGEIDKTERLKMSLSLAEQSAAEDRPIFTRETDLGAGVISAPIRIKGEVFGVINVAGDPAKDPLTENAVRLLTTVATQASVAIQNSILFAEINDMYASTVRTLAEVIDAKDHYTHGHSERVAEISAAIAGEMELGREEIEAIRTAAFLHDIGKISVPDAILHKVEPLTDEEREIIKTHPMAAAKILEPIMFPWDVATMVAQSHEHYDGGGYPKGLKGEEIELGARIILIADAFEVLTTGRSYRQPLTRGQALAEIKNCAGTQFDPLAVVALENSQRLKWPRERTSA